MRYGMVIDLKTCIGCYGCQVFCKSENSTPYGMTWSKVLFYETGKFPAARKIPLPVLCMHCAEPGCVDVCPTGASIKRVDGIVTVDSNKCTGCLNCIPSCPYGARYLYKEDRQLFPGQGSTVFEKITNQKHKIDFIGKCDFCLHRIEEGLLPACVRNCMTGARHFGDLDDPDSEVSKLIKGDGVCQLTPALVPGQVSLRSSIKSSVYYLLP